MDTHDATNDIAHKAHDCPFFQQGCPFAKNATFDVAAIKKHPAFAAGCPYKGVDMSTLKECPAFKDHKCPFDGTHQIDISKIQQCPAFKDGCPFAHKHEKHDHANMTEHAATEHIAVEATKCPIFAHSNCPFDPKHPHSFNLSKVTECPAFQRNGGCPFKNVHIERLHECPAFKDGKCPFNGAKEVDLSRIKECPAFAKGCPYASLHAATTTTHNVWDTRAFFVHISEGAQLCPIFSKQQGGCPYDPNHRRSFDVSKAKDCPAFQKSGGCPFKNVQIERIEACPAFKDGKCPFNGTTEIDLSRLSECPSFKNGCPYKAITAPTKGATQHPPTSSSAQPSASLLAPASEDTGKVHTTNSSEAAKCPFASMHDKVENPHK
jgi:hypothetical protein